MDQKKIDAMRVGGKIMAKIFAELREYTQAGKTGKEIDAWVARLRTMVAELHIMSQKLIFLDQFVFQ